MKTIVFSGFLLLGWSFVSVGQNPDWYSEFAGEGQDKIEMIVVTGTPYEMEMALGAHFKKSAGETMKAYLHAALSESSAHAAPENLLQTWSTNEPYMDKRFIEEAEGFAKGSGIDLNLIKEAHAIPFIVPYSCSTMLQPGESGFLMQPRRNEPLKETIFMLI